MIYSESKAKAFGGNLAADLECVAHGGMIIWSGPGGVNCINPNPRGQVPKRALMF